VLFIVITLKRHYVKSHTNSLPHNFIGYELFHVRILHKFMEKWHHHVAGFIDGFVNTNKRIYMADKIFLRWRKL